MGRPSVKSLLLACILLPAIAGAAQYPYFAPGGALSCTGACTQQTVNLAAGSSFITGTLPLANILTCATTQIVFDSAGALVCSSAFTWTDSTHTLQLGTSATPAIITAPTVTNAPGVGLTVKATNGNGTNQAGGSLTFDAGTGTASGGSDDGTLNFNGGGAGALTFTMSGGNSPDVQVLQFITGDWTQTCNFGAADSADCLFIVQNNNSNGGDYTHIQYLAGSGNLIDDISVLPSTATLISSQCSIAAKPVVCELISGTNAKYDVEATGGELVLSGTEVDLAMNFGGKFFKGTSSGTTIATTAGDNGHAGSVTNVIGGSSLNTQANGVPILTGNTLTPTGSGCSITAFVATGTSGGNGLALAAGSFTSGTTGTCTVTITFPAPAVAHSWVCRADDLSTPANFIGQSSAGTGSCIVTGTTVSGDLMNFSATGF